MSGFIVPVANTETLHGVLGVLATTEDTVSDAAIAEAGSFSLQELSDFEQRLVIQGFGTDSYDRLQRSPEPARAFLGGLRAMKASLKEGRRAGSSEAERTLASKFNGLDEKWRLSARIAATVVLVESEPSFQLEDEEHILGVGTANSCYGSFAPWLLGLSAIEQAMLAVRPTAKEHFSLRGSFFEWKGKYYAKKNSAQRAVENFFKAAEFYIDVSAYLQAAHLFFLAKAIQNSWEDEQDLMTPMFDIAELLSCAAEALKDADEAEKNLSLRIAIEAKSISYSTELNYPRRLADAQMKFPDWFRMLSNPEPDLLSRISIRHFLDAAANYIISDQIGSAEAAFNRALEILRQGTVEIAQSLSRR